VCPSCADEVVPQRWRGQPPPDLSVDDMSPTLKPFA